MKHEAIRAWYRSMGYDKRQIRRVARRSSNSGSAPIVFPSVGEPLLYVAHSHSEWKP